MFHSATQTVNSLIFLGADHPNTKLSTILGTVIQMELPTLFKSKWNVLNFYALKILFIYISACDHLTFIKAILSNNNSLISWSFGIFNYFLCLIWNHIVLPWCKNGSSYTHFILHPHIQLQSCFFFNFRAHTRKSKYAPLKKMQDTSVKYISFIF